MLILSWILSSLYLKAHLYGNGTTKDLWAGITKATGQDINKIMSNWTGKVGFPVLTVIEEADGLKISQKRFLSTGDPKVRCGLLQHYQVSVSS